MKIFLSQPMNGKTEEQIRDERKIACAGIEKYFDDDITFIDSYISDIYDEKHPGLQYLAQSIKMLDEADMIVLFPGWENARGCRIEHECAKAYGIPISYWR